MSNLTCVICKYSAPSEFDLETHIDYNHAEISQPQSIHLLNLSNKVSLINQSNDVSRQIFPETDVNLDKSEEDLESDEIAPDVDDLMKVPIQDLFNGSTQDETRTCPDVQAPNLDSAIFQKLKNVSRIKGGTSRNANNENKTKSRRCEHCCYRTKREDLLQKHVTTKHYKIKSSETKPGATSEEEKLLKISNPATCQSENLMTEPRTKEVVLNEESVFIDKVIDEESIAAAFEILTGILTIPPTKQENIETTNAANDEAKDLKLNQHTVQMEVDSDKNQTNEEQTHVVTDKVINQIKLPIEMNETPTENLDETKTITVQPLLKDNTSESSYLEITMPVKTTKALQIIQETCPVNLSEKNEIKQAFASKTSSMDSGKTIYVLPVISTLPHSTKKLNSLLKNFKFTSNISIEAQRKKNKSDQDGSNTHPTLESSTKSPVEMDISTSNPNQNSCLTNEISVSKQINFEPNTFESIQNNAKNSLFERIKDKTPLLLINEGQINKKEPPLRSSCAKIVLAKHKELANIHPQSGLHLNDSEVKEDPKLLGHCEVKLDNFNKMSIKNDKPIFARKSLPFAVPKLKAHRKRKSMIIHKQDSNKNIPDKKARNIELAECDSTLKLLATIESLKNDVSQAENENKVLKAGLSSTDDKNNKLMKENDQLKSHIKELEIKDAEMSDLKEAREELTRKLRKLKVKAENEIVALYSNATRLEAEVTRLNKEHANDVKIIDENKETILTMSEKIKSTSAELSAVKLSEERSLIEVVNLRKEIQIQSTNFQAKHFNNLRKTLEFILEKDAMFCKSDQNTNEVLDDSEAFEMINFLLHETNENKVRHFQDLHHCISKLKKTEDKKSGYKKTALAFSKQADDLTKTLEQRDQQVRDLEKKTLALTKQIEEKEKKQNIDSSLIKMLQQEMAEKSEKLKDLRKFEQQREFLQRYMSAAQQTIFNLQKRLEDAEKKSGTVDLTHEINSLQKESSLMEIVLKELNYNNSLLVQQLKDADLKVKQLEFKQELSLNTIQKMREEERNNKEEKRLIELLEKLIFEMEKRIRTNKIKFAKKEKIVKELELEMKEKDKEFSEKLFFYNSTLADMKEKVTTTLNAKNSRIKLMSQHLNNQSIMIEALQIELGRKD